jgi:opacity protein-like surface antigen
MKLLTLITAAGSVTATAFAGEPAPVQTAPAPAPTLGGWFAGVGFGQFESESNLDRIANNTDPTGRGFDYLADPDGYSDITRASGGYGDKYGIDDFEFEMYTLHIGRDLGTQFLGCDLAAYFEVGYLDGDAEMTFRPFQSSTRGLQTAGVDIDIIPITFNLLAEREFFAGIKGYISGGIGYAFTDASFNGESDTDGGFYAQASIGLAYDINEQWEIYGGARYIFLGDLDLGDSLDGAELDDSIGYEIGLRYSF